MVLGVLDHEQREQRDREGRSNEAADQRQRDEAALVARSQIVVADDERRLDPARHT